MKEETMKEEEKMKEGGRAILVHELAVNVREQAGRA